MNREFYDTYNLEEIEREHAGIEAGLEYLPNDFRIIKYGEFVTCAMTGEKIQLSYLKYWSVEHQIPFKDCLVGESWRKMMQVGDWSPEGVKSRKETMELFNSMRENKNNDSS